MYASYYFRLRMIVLRLARINAAVTPVKKKPYNIGYTVDAAQAGKPIRLVYRWFFLNILQFTCPMIFKFLMAWRYFLQVLKNHTCLHFLFI